MKLTNTGKCLVYKIYAFLIYLIPMSILFFVNLGEYDRDAGIFGFWGFVVLAFIILAFKNYVLEFFKKRTLLTVSIIFFIVSFITRYIADELLLITAVSMIAALLSTFVEIVADTYNEYSYKTVDGVRTKNLAPALTDKEAWRLSYGFILTNEEDNEEDKE